MPQDKVEQHQKNVDNDLSQSQLQTPKYKFDIDKLLKTSEKLKRSQASQKSKVDQSQLSDSQNNQEKHPLAISAIDINTKVAQQIIPPLQFMEHQHNNSPSDQRRNSSPIMSHKERFSNQIHKSPRGSQGYEISPNILGKSAEIYAQSVNQTGFKPINNEENSQLNINELYKQIQILQQIVSEQQFQNKNTQHLQPIPAQYQNNEPNHDQIIQQFNLYDISSIIGYIIGIIANVISLIDTQKYKIQTLNVYNSVMLNIVEIFICITLMLNLFPIARLNNFMQKNFRLSKNYLFNAVVIFVLISIYQLNFNKFYGLIWMISSIIILVMSLPCITNIIFYILTLLKNNPNIQIEKQLFKIHKSQIGPLSQENLIVKSQKKPKKKSKQKLNIIINDIQQHAQSESPQQTNYVKPRLLPTSAVGMDSTLQPDESGWNNYYDLQKTIQTSKNQNRNTMTPTLDVL